MPSFNSVAPIRAADRLSRQLHGHAGRLWQRLIRQSPAAREARPGFLIGSDCSRRQRETAALLQLTGNAAYC
ncbi:MAG: hypothetical protein KDJ41_21245, partial [Hyphomicrobiaceae bacterium]|nr:hypothetical protein [Hyphomicrobiaceae bacterium]